MSRVSIAIAAAFACWPLVTLAEVKSAAADSFLIAQRYVVQAPAAKVWASLMHPERWWPANHTWSGKRENLSLGPDVGDCFCERWDGNAVEHGHVVFSMPGRMLRLNATLGPLQELAVSGDASQQLDKRAAIVDQVNAQQFGGLAADAAK